MPPYSAQFDLVGQRFGRLTVVRRGPTYVRPNGKTGNTTWVCRCDCGKETTVIRPNLTSGRQVSCGCTLGEDRRKARTTHGCSYKKVYWTWSKVIMRCRNPNCQDYADYGGRGITVCDEWAASFEAFYADMGEPPTPHHEIDRTDNSRGYEPGNCQWVTRKENVRNRRNTVRMTLGDETKSMAEWSEITGIDYGTLKTRRKLGWSDERSLTTPVDTRIHGKRIHP